MNSTVSFANQSNISSSDIIYGGVAFFLSNLGEYFPYTFLSTLSTFIGIIGRIIYILKNILTLKRYNTNNLKGNLLIMGAIIVTKELHTVSNMFVFNLAISDILISGIVESFTSVGT